MPDALTLCPERGALFARRRLRLIRFAIVLIVAGGALGYYGWSEYQLGSGSSDTPQEITLAELAENGPGNNAHVKVTNLALLDNYVVEEDKKTHRWSKLYVPAVGIETPTDEDGMPIASKFNVLIKSSKYSSEASAAALWAKESITGVVINKIASLGSDEKRLIAQSYPTVNISTVWIVEEGRKPTSSVTAMAMMGGGALLILLTIGFMVKGASASGSKK